MTQNNEIEFGSVKSSCGHAEAAAGVLGVMSVISILHRQNGGQTRHLCEVNPFIAQILSRQEQSFLAATAKRQASSSPTDNLSDPTAGKVVWDFKFCVPGDKCKCYYELRKKFDTQRCTELSRTSS